MPDAQANPLIVAISSRTLFDLEDSHDYDADWQNVPTNDVFLNGFRQQWEEYLESYVLGTEYDGPSCRLPTSSSSTTTTSITTSRRIRIRAMRIARRLTKSAS